MALGGIMASCLLKKRLGRQVPQIGTQANRGDFATGSGVG